VKQAHSCELAATAGERAPQHLDFHVHPRAGFSQRRARRVPFLPHNERWAAGYPANGTSHSPESSIDFHQEGLNGPGDGRRRTIGNREFQPPSVRLQFYKHPSRFSATRPGCEPLPGQSTLQRLKVPTRTNGSVLGQTIPPSAPRRAISKCDCLVGRLSFRMRLFPSPDPRQNPLDFSMQSSTPRFRRSQSRTLAIPSPRYTRYSGNPSSTLHRTPGSLLVFFSLPELRR
jgi:hypothetical protein